MTHFAPIGIKDSVMSKLILALALILAACAPSVDAVQTAIAETQAGWTAVPSLTPHLVIQTQVVVHTRVVGPSRTPPPPATATLEGTPLPPAATVPATPTQDPLRQPVPDGIYLIGVDMAPGIWRSDGSGNDCYWRLTDRTGDTVKNYFGAAGGTAYLPPDGFEIRFERCGTWSFYQAP